MFQPDLIIVEKEALEYPLGQALWNRFEEEKRKVKIINSNRITSIEGETAKEKYNHAKNTLVIGVRKTLNFQSCKPSAHYQLPLVTGCMGMCEYCYLNTNLASRSYIRIYVNLEEILTKAKQYIQERAPEVTIFEAAATSDPLPVEGYTKALETCIRFFAKEPLGRLRFVSKYPFVDSFLNLEHHGHTEIRFSLNTNRVITEYEHRTSSMEKRIEALAKVKKAGYPSGAIIAPVFLYDGWKEEYEQMLFCLKNELQKQEAKEDISFEVITHRYTKNAKNKILEFYPDTTLPMEETKRKFKYGQFGYGKYLYKPEEIEEVKTFFTEKITKWFPFAKILYII